MMLPFNKPYLTGNEVHYIYDAASTGKISGNGKYTQMCQKYFEDRWGFRKTLLTTSCTDALEMCALLLDIKPGDEVIVPSYTFVSTALAFVRQGAKIIFADSRLDHPGINEDKIEELINPNTRALVVVHYAGVACDMNKVMSIANRYKIFVIEDAAQAVDSYYSSTSKTKHPKQSNKHHEINHKTPLGTIGHLAAFSFHETKNIHCGEGGLLGINDERFVKRAEIIWEKGTNRAEFFRGEVNKYGWVDTGSSFLPSEISAAFLWAQLEELDTIQTRRQEIWEAYYNGIIGWAEKNGVQMPFIPHYATNNGHMFYLVCPDAAFRDNLINQLKTNGVHSVFHYLSLHNSPYYTDKHDGRMLPESDRYSDCLIRLPLFYALTNEDIEQVIRALTF
jgi:dTDP-4-amino-4,6-dideoxygalactose transaminase